MHKFRICFTSKETKRWMLEVLLVKAAPYHARQNAELKQNYVSWWKDKMEKGPTASYNYIWKWSDARQLVGDLVIRYSKMWHQPSVSRDAFHQLNCRSEIQSHRWDTVLCASVYMHVQGYAKWCGETEGDSRALFLELFPLLGFVWMYDITTHIGLHCDFSYLTFDPTIATFHAVMASKTNHLITGWLACYSVGVLWTHGLI